MSPHRLSICLAGLLVAATVASVSSAEPGLVGKPEAVVEGQAVRISFELSAATDVAVAILDRDGRPVRHLAAGLLGENPPAPLRAGSLTQTMLWDGCDDVGRPLPAGQYTVNVSTGLGLRFSRVIGWDGQRTGQLFGLAVGPEGMTYLLCESGRDTGDPRVVLFNPAGRYQRTIVPRPAGLPMDRVEPLGELALDDGRRIVLELLSDFGGRMLQTPAVSPEGDLILVSGPNRGHVLGKRFQSVAEAVARPRRLLRIASDGGAPRAGYLGPVLPKAADSSVVHLALSPDGKTVYVSGAGHAVCRAAWSADERLSAVFGNPDQAGGGETGLKDPAGIAVDAEGNLLVADRGNHRVVKITPAGKLLGQFPVEWPSQVRVHPKSGAVYVIAGYKPDRLVKFDPAGKQLAELTFRSDGPVIALDGRAGPATIYLGNVRLAADQARPAAYRLTDAGHQFDLGGLLTADEGPLQPLLLGVDRQRELVYGIDRTNHLQYFRVHGSGQQSVDPFTVPVHPKANGVHELTVAADGTLAVHVTGEFGRLDWRLRPLPFAAINSFIVRLAGDDCIRSFYDRGSCIAPNGDIYWVHERGGYSKPMMVTALNADGSLKADQLVLLETRSAGHVRVDNEGCVYLLDHVKPVGRLVPDDFAGKTPLKREDKVIYNYGSLVKFKPTGGAIRELSPGPPQKRDLPAGQLQFTTAEGRGDFVTEGALWSYYGVSMIQPALDRNNRCLCNAPRFDLDGFARAFVPDQMRHRVTVLDRNGNVLLHVGRYGNADDAGPDVALADPRTVMVSRDAAYIGDMANSRIVRAAMTYRTSASCPIQLPARPASPAEQKVAAVRKFLVDETAERSPALRSRLDWDGLAAPAADAPADVMTDQARIRLLLALRDVRDWPADEAAELLAHYLADPSDRIRLAAIWAMWDNPAGKRGADLLAAALTDKCEMIRVTAADTLLHLKDARGLAEVLRAARSPDPDVYKLAETAILRKVVVWQPDHPKAYTLEPWSALVGVFPVGPAEIEALAQLLAETKAPTDKTRSFWHLRQMAIILLCLSERPEAVGPLLDTLQFEATNPAGRNRNRVIGGMGLLRVRQATPDLVKYLARGAGTEAQREHGDKAEVFAADALARLADPDSVAGVIGLLDSATPTVAGLARRCLSRMFDPDIPADRCLAPRDGRLEPVRIDQLPEPKQLRADWEAFWQANRQHYPFNPAGPLVRK